MIIGTMRLNTCGSRISNLCQRPGSATHHDDAASGQSQAKCDAGYSHGCGQRKFHDVDHMLSQHFAASDMCHTCSVSHARSDIDYLRPLFFALAPLILLQFGIIVLLRSFLGILNPICDSAADIDNASILSQPCMIYRLQQSQLRIVMIGVVDKNITVLRGCDDLLSVLAVVYVVARGS